MEQVEQVEQVDRGSELASVYSFILERMAERRKLATPESDEQVDQSNSVQGIIRDTNVVRFG